MERVGVDAYVTRLVEYVKKVHKWVDEQHAHVREGTQRAKYRELGPGYHYSVGEYVMVKRPPEPGVSKRFQKPTYDQVYQVVEVHGEGQDAKAYTLSELSGSRECGFAQPVHQDRLIPVELLPLAHAEDDISTRILVQEQGRQDRKATIKAQSADGKVYIEYDDDLGHDVCVDLCQLKYQWLTAEEPDTQFFSHLPLR